MNSIELPRDWPARVRIAVATRDLPGFSRPPYGPANFGDRCGDDPEAVAANRAALVGWFNLPSAPVFLRQVHGTGVLDLDRGPPDAPIEADALVCHTPGRVGAILSADCLPIVIAAPESLGYAAVHAGWRGLAAGVIEAALAALAAAPSRCMAWIGPAISAARYEVDAIVRSAFVGDDANAAAAFKPVRAGHWHCDLQALARARLARAGLSRVAASDWCTFCDVERLHSYRRDADASGRIATLAWIEAP